MEEREFDALWRSRMLASETSSAKGISSNFKHNILLGMCRTFHIRVVSRVSPSLADCSQGSAKVEITLR